MCIVNIHVYVYINHGIICTCTCIGNIWLMVYFIVCVCRYLCSLPTSVSVRPLSPEMTDCPLLREGNLDTQVINNTLLLLYYYIIIFIIRVVSSTQ